MFSKLIDTIRDTLVRAPTSNKQQPVTDTEDRTVRERRPSVTEHLQQDDAQSMLTRFSTTQSMPIGRHNSISESVPVNTPDSKKRRRSSTLFGISNVSYDDYVQKDLISSSWS